MKRIPHKEEPISGTDSAADYAEKEGWEKSIYTNLAREILKHKVKGPYLEIGCGTGYLASLILAENPSTSIVATDISPSMIKAGRKAHDRLLESGRLHFLAGGGQDRKFLSGLGKFNLVYSTFSLHHWEAPAEIIKNLYDATAPGGLLFIHDLRRIAWLYYLPFNDGDFESIRASYTRRELREIMRKTGITDYSVSSDFPYYSISIIIRKKKTAPKKNG